MPLPCLISCQVAEIKTAAAYQRIRNSAVTRGAPLNSMQLHTTSGFVNCPLSTPHQMNYLCSVVISGQCNRLKRKLPCLLPHFELNSNYWRDWYEETPLK